MTVQDTTPQTTFVGTGAQLIFVFTFRADDITWLSVDFTTNFDKFTVNADQDGDPGGTVEYTVAPPLAQELTVLRDTPNTQNLDYTRYDPFDSEATEDSIDKLTMQIQDLDNFIQQTLTQEFDLLSNVDFSTKVDGSMIYWHDGNQLWQDTASFMNFVSNILTMNTNVLFNFQATHTNRVQIRTGNDLEMLDPTNIRAMQQKVNAGFDLDFASTGADLIDVTFSNFTGRVKQDLETLAYLSELPTLISDHTLLTNIGVNTHAQIDTHIADGTIHFSEASIDHTAINNIGVNSHGVIDSHIGDASIHFVQTAIDHTVLLNIGTNTHAQIDSSITTLNSHIADATIHYVDAPADGQDYVRRDNLWEIAAYLSLPDHGTLPGLADDDHPQYHDGTLAYTGNLNMGGFNIQNIESLDVNRENNIIGLAIDGDVGNATNPAIGMLFLGLNSYRRVMAWGEAGSYQFFMDADLTAAAPVQELVFGSITNATMMQIREDGLVTFAGVYEFPIVDGAAGEVLTTDGLGVLTFQAGGGGVTDHFLLTNIGVNTHVQIDTHIADATIHFTEGSIDHLNIANIGVNSHAAIDTHIADATIHFTEGSIDHGNIAGLADDDHLQYLFLAGRAGGQVAIGGTAAGENLTLQGSTDADRGRNLIAGGANVDWDWTTDAVTEGGLYFNTTVPASGALVSAQIRLQNTIGVNSGVFIMSAVHDSSQLTWSVAPTFAVTTLFFAQQAYRTSTPGVGPAQALIFSAGSQYWNTGAGDVTTSQYKALSFTPIIRVDNNADRMRITNVTGMSVTPTYNTRNANSTADFGTIRGVHMTNAVQILFGQGLGTEIATSWIGLDMEPLTGLAVSGDKVAVRSAIAVGVNNFFLQNPGGAESDFLAGDIHLNDNTWMKYGAAIATPDQIHGWDATQSAFVMSTFFGTGGNALYFEGTANDEWLIRQNDGGLNDIGIGFDVNVVVFGTAAPTPNSQNYFVRFEGPANRQVQSAGVYSDIWWTAGGSIDVNGFAATEVNNYRIDTSLTVLNGGTVDDQTSLFVAGMAFAGGAATRVQALRVNGRTRVDGLMNYNEASLAQLTADVAALTLPATNSGRFMILQDADANGPWTIQGVVNDQPGDAFYIINDGANDFILGHEDAAAAAADRIISPTGVDLTLGPDEMAKLWYDPVVTRWRILETTGA